MSHEYCVEGSIIILPILIPEQAFIKHKLAIAKVIVIFNFQISNSALAPKRKFYFLDLCKILHIKRGYHHLYFSNSRDLIITEKDKLINSGSVTLD